MGRARGTEVDLFRACCRGRFFELESVFTDLTLELLLEVGGEGLLLGVNILGVVDLGRLRLLIGGDSE